MALMLVAAPAAQAARLSTSAATAAAERVAERYANAANADDHGVDTCERRGRRTIACDVFVSISVDESTQRECTATVTVRLGTRRRAKPVATTSRWHCEDEQIAGEGEDDADVPAEDDEPVGYEEDDVA